VLDDGRLEMDNNLIENKVRSLALGRKNYLFDDSHNAAQRIAMMYSFFATCKANDVNPYEWLKTTLDRIPDHLVNRLDELLPAKRYHLCPALKYLYRAKGIFLFFEGKRESYLLKKISVPNYHLDYKHDRLHSFIKTLLPPLPIRTSSWQVFSSIFQV